MPTTQDKTAEAIDNNFARQFGNPPTAISANAAF